MMGIGNVSVQLQCTAVDQLQGERQLPGKAICLHACLWASLRHLVGLRGEQKDLIIRLWSDPASLYLRHAQILGHLLNLFSHILFTKPK